MYRTFPAKPNAVRLHRATSQPLKVAIVVRTKDRPQLLTRCLQSLAEQKYLPHEVVVINDGGTPVDMVVNQFPLLTVHLWDNPTSQGRARAGNQGVTLAQSDVIGFLDDDDRYLPDHLLRLQKAMQHFDAPVVYSGCRLVQRDMLGETVILREQETALFNEPFEAERLRYENYIPLINLLIKRDLWVAIGGFDETFDLFEDWDVLLRLSQQVRFYHVSQITTEYAIWGTSQITRAVDNVRWKQAYRQFLQKHLMGLPDDEKLQILQDYWFISQERRGILRDHRQENQTLRLQLLEKQQSVLQLQHRLDHEVTTYRDQIEHFKKQAAHLETQTLHLQDDLRERDKNYNRQYQRLEDQLSEREKVYSQQCHRLEEQLNEREKAYSQQCRRIEEQLTEREKGYHRLEEEAREQRRQAARHIESLQAQITALEEAVQKYTEEYEKVQTECQEATQRAGEMYRRTEWLEKSLHEVNKQCAVGVNGEAIKQIFFSRPVTAYALGTSTGSIIDDYHRLIAWIRNKAHYSQALTHPWQDKQQAIKAAYQTVHHQLNHLIEIIHASHWPQVRRYAEEARMVRMQLERLFAETQACITEGTQLSTQLGLDTLVASKAAFPERETQLPPPRPLSPCYPVFVTIAGTEQTPKFMENVTELGTDAFLLDAGCVLTFTTYCSLNHFFRLDLMLGTRLRINLCHIRVILRDLQTLLPIRVAYLQGLTIFDNRFHAITFEPIADSAGKTYQIEIDSPDASETAGVAVWCHPKPPKPLYYQQLGEESCLRAPQLLPLWVQHALSDLPLSPRLTDKQAIHLFMLGGIHLATPTLNVSIFLQRLEKALTLADTTGQIVICGQLSRELRSYCQERQLLTLVLETQTMVDLFNWSRSQPTAQIVWCCTIDALPAEDMVVRGQNMLSDPQVGMLVPQEKHSDGKIRAAYATVVRDGAIVDNVTGSPASHPYYGYRRVVNAASSRLVILRMEALKKIEAPALRAYHTPLYRLADVIWQLKAHRWTTLYQAALQYVNDQPNAPIDLHLYDQDRILFHERWGTTIPRHLAAFSTLSELLNPDCQPTVLIIDATLPMYDEDSGSLRLYTLLKIWRSLGYRITFFPDNLDSNPKYRYALEDLGIEVFHSHYGMADALAYRQFDFIFVCRVEMGSRYLSFLQVVQPNAIIFYDTVDIHYIREQRQAEIEQNLELAQLAQTTKRKELANCLLAHRVITVTEEDGLHLQQEIPNLPFAVLPNIHLPHPEAETTFEEREGLMFIGNYNHLPNQDSVFFFVEQVLPKIHAQLPAVKLYLVGSYMTEAMKALANEYIKPIGWVEVVEPEFAARRVFVSYLRYGAGMKGKLGQSLSLGLPVVTTSIGAEGMGLIQEETALIADDPDTFAKEVCRLYTEKTLWEKLSAQGKHYIEERYGETAAKRKLQALLSEYTKS